LRIRFEAPPGFVLFNSPRQVVAKGPKKSVMMFDMAKEKSAREARSLKRYIAGTWASGLSLTGLERISINGMDAATAGARANNKDIRLIAIRGDSDQIFRLLFVTPPQMTGKLAVDFRRATYSFRRISKAEADAIKPLRIKVVTVKDGDTPSSLAAGFPFESFRLRWFETLNGLRPGERLNPGARAKIVVE
jgi:predicted Zn-dependent protease